MDKEYQELWLHFIKDPAALPLSEADILDGGDFHGIWADSNDETLRSGLGALNSVLNEPKSRSKGLTHLLRFLQQVPPSRWITILQGLTSSIHLALKSIHLVPAQCFLSFILPNSHTIPELNQLIGSTVVPKVLSNFTSWNSCSEMTSSALQLLKLCLLKYHGPCANHRFNLEKKLVDLLDKDELPLQELAHIEEIWPLLSQTGGGSAGGARHSKDWQSMVIKISGVIQDTVLQLYGDWCPVIGTDNPFISPDYPNLCLKTIKEKDVLTRITKTKNRLVRLVNILCHYLNDPFPAPKPVPDFGLFQIIRLFFLLNPIELLNSFVTPPKEIIYLALILPKIHIVGFKLLTALIICLEDNILIHSKSVEQIIIHELKWMSQQPDNFSDLKINLYSTIETYLEQTSNLLVSSKTIVSLTKQILTDIEIKTSVVELGKMSGKTKTVKNTSQVTVISSSKHVIFERNPDICYRALKVLSRIIVGELEPQNFKAIYIKICSTICEILNFNTSFPSPYDKPACRDELFTCLVLLLQNPLEGAPISLSFLTHLSVHRQLDFVAGAEASIQLLGLIEKLIHPIRPSLSLAPIPVNSPDVGQGDFDRMEFEVEQPRNTPLVSKMDNFSQTVVDQVANGTKIETLLEHSIQKVFNKYMESGVFSLEASSSIKHNNMDSFKNGKRNYEDSENLQLNPEGRRLTNGESVPKQGSCWQLEIEQAKSVTNYASPSPELEAMLKDFIDSGPDTL